MFALKTFQGVRYALFNFNESGHPGGYADFDSFVLEEPVANAAIRQIPLGKTIELTCIADGSRLIAWNGHLRPVDASSELATSSATRFQVLDRGQGRIALKSADDLFVKVIGQGAAGDVRLVSTESGQASLFQWQDLLNGDIMLLSLHTNRYLQALPNVGELATANSPGATPDRKGGSCFRWKIAE